MQSTRTTDVPLLGGALAGALTWILGYVLTYLLVAPDIRESALNQFVEAFEGAPATYEMVGWVFYNAHFVDVVFSNIPFVGSRSGAFIGGQDGFTTLLYVVPPALLVAAGLALSRRQGATTPGRGTMAGMTVVPAYLVLSIAGAFLFEVSALGARGAPDLLPAVVLAGVIYPLLFAGAGGALGGLFERRSQAPAVEGRE